MSKTVPHCLLVMSWGRDGVGGVNQVVNNLCKQLKDEKDLDVSLLIRDWDALKVKAEESSDVPVYRFNIPDFFEEKSRWILRCKMVIKFIIRLYPLYCFIKNNNITIVNLHYPSSYALAFAILKYLGVIKGLILSFHGAEFTKLNETEFYKYGIWNFIFDNSDNIIACSESFANQIKKSIPDKNKIISFVHNGVDTDLLKLDITQITKKVDESCYTILCVGTFEHKKGHDILIEAFKKLHTENPSLNLIIIGRSTPYLKTIKDQINDLKLVNNVSLICDLKHEDLIKYYRMADVFVLPSRIEPFGIVGLEAGLFGLPVVASDTGGIPEYIRHHINGCLFPVGDVDTLISELKCLIDDKQFSNDLGEQLQNDVLQYYNWEVGAAKYKGIIHKIHSCQEIL